jgi:hypothetical protein
MPTLDEAARQLDAELRKYNWYLTLGTGRTEEGPAIFVYTKSGRHRRLHELSRGWMGYKVIISPIGSIKAVGSPFAEKRKASA